MNRDQVADIDPEIVLADGFDDAFLGVAFRCGSPSVAVYDYAQCVKILMTRDEMTHEDALEWMEFNVVGAYVGPRTPWFLTTASDLEGRVET